MNGVNLHHVVRGLITAIHPDEVCTLYQAEGQINVKGIVKAQYNAPQEAKISIQPLDSQTLNHLERIGDTKASEQVFLYSDFALPVAGIQRLPLLRTGDFIQRDDGTYWLITSVLEDWSWDGWANAGITQQLVPPDFTASDWYNKEGEVDDSTEPNGSS